ncbi:hypothetical protein DPMN_002946 [Dreissena polymorpha]|uniref:HAT C-terminal dimerisation domain-containing protein n=4 Tax=Dreissena polymorpha TaxID=45954 RepID=A0A9D3YE75_DREPO|nr:hypothetical protein DPMN_084244 [Dreissena polymorpha]KAH3879045.1 hypothetical protein DPMN_002946 [Dreissena polymorpha]
MHIAQDDIMQESYPTVLQLYKLALLVPQSTAVVERGFSAMNDMCTDLRSLGQQTLDSLMRINLYQEELLEEDLELVVDLFKNKKERDMPL